MKRIKKNINTSTFPQELRSFIGDADIYDSSCSQAASVLFIDRDKGYFLKSAASGALKTEAELTQYFYSKQLSAAVVAYISEERDWLLTEKISGEDCTYSEYLDDPKRLCSTLASILRDLHESDHSECPIKNRNEIYLQTAERNYQRGRFKNSIFTEEYRNMTAAEAQKLITQETKYLKSDVLLHGDCCLPNILLDSWSFNGFVDLGNAGVGNRHFDLFWCAWSLCYNLHTESYKNLFFDAYGRSDIDPDALRLVAALEAFS